MTLHFLLIILQSYQLQPFANNLCAWINHSITPFLFLISFSFFFPLNSRLLYFAQLWNVCPTNHPRLRLQHSANKIPRKKQLLRSNGIRLRGEHNCLMLVTELISASDICRCIKPVVQWNSKSMVLNIKQRRMVLFLFTSIYQSCRV